MATAAVQPPIFRRPPRRPVFLGTGEFEVDAPPPQRDGSVSVSIQSLVQRVLMGLPFPLLALGGVLFVGGGNLFMALGSALVMGIIPIGLGVYEYRSQKRAQAAAVQERSSRYRAYLASRIDELNKRRGREAQILLEMDPGPQECQLLARRLDPRLWERTPSDDDFLALRAGLGWRPTSFQVKVPTQNVDLYPDPLVKEAQRIAQDFAGISGVPVLLPLGRAGAAGIAVPGGSATNLLRALLVQLATNHSPEEVKIAAVFREDQAAEWEWLRWLPHVWSEDRVRRYLARDEPGAKALVDHLAQTVALRSQGDDQDSTPPVPSFVLVVTDQGLVRGAPGLKYFMGSERRLGAYALFLADSESHLPRECRASLTLAGSETQLFVKGQNAEPIGLQADAVSSQFAGEFARALAPIRVEGLAVTEAVPLVVPLLDLIGVDKIEELDLAERWRRNDPVKSLAVPVGRRDGGRLLSLDLHGGETPWYGGSQGQGPHGLIAGTAGAGKGQLLQTLVASLAGNFHPHEVAFVLVDFKGGDMARPLEPLPHVLATLTNLENALDAKLVRRALDGLTREKERRQEIITRYAGAPNIYEYQARFRRGEVPEPLPHLFVVVDEFRELKESFPEMVSELISIASVGRSLGIHLVLSTQNPAGIVDDMIWANSRFRICLKMTGAEFSRAVLKRPEAAEISITGRALLQVSNVLGAGDLDLTQFQSGWAAAPYQPGVAQAKSAPLLQLVSLDGSRRPLGNTHALTQADPTAPDQLSVLVDHICMAAEQQGIKRLPPPWLPALPEEVELSQVEPAPGWDGRGWGPAPRPWLAPVVGLVDDPARQLRAPLALPLSRDGHLALYGAPASGKTTFLETLAVSLARSWSPDDLWIYGLDFGGRALKRLEGLPHTGDVVLGDETERVIRLLRVLERRLDERERLFAQEGVNTAAAYRAGGGKLPAIVLLLDNYLEFRSAYPDADEILMAIAREGANRGIYLVFTAQTPLRVPTSLTTSVNLAIALRLSDRGEYPQALGGKRPQVEPAGVPGRGLIKADPPLEFQIALPAAGDTEADRAATIRQLCEAMDAAWEGPRPPRIQALPQTVPLSQLMGTSGSQDGLRLPLGLDVDDLSPVSVDLRDGPHFLVAGPAECGKNTLLQAWLLALAAHSTPDRLHLYLIDPRMEGLIALAPLPHRKGVPADDAAIGELVTELEGVLTARRTSLQRAQAEAGGFLDEEARRSWLVGQPVIVVAIADWEAFRDATSQPTRDRLDALMRRERDVGFHVLMAGLSTVLSSSFGGVVGPLKEGKTGFLLGSTDVSDLQLFGLTKLPHTEVGRQLPPGQGYYVSRTGTRKIKVATPHAGSPTLREWVSQLAANGAREK